MIVFCNTGIMQVIKDLYVTTDRVPIADISPMFIPLTKSVCKFGNSGSKIATPSATLINEFYDCSLCLLGRMNKVANTQPTHECNKGENESHQE